MQVFSLTDDVSQRDKQVDKSWMLHLWFVENRHICVLVSFVYLNQPSWASINVNFYKYPQYVYTENAVFIQVVTVNH